jgi:hypothetical protein
VISQLVELCLHLGVWGTAQQHKLAATLNGLQQQRE